MYLMDKFTVRPDPWDNRIIVSIAWSGDAHQLGSIVAML